MTNNEMKPEEEGVVDRELAGKLAGRTIAADVVFDALEGLRERRARELLSWARGTGEPEKALAAWGRKHGRQRQRELVREQAPKRARRAALEGTLRVTFRKQLAAEDLLARREAALAGGPGAHDEEVRARVEPARRKDILFDGERIEVETLSLRMECAKEYPAETLERKMGFDPDAEREFERRVSDLRFEGDDGDGEGLRGKLSCDDLLRVEVYEISARALVDELSAQVEFLEARLYEVLPENGSVWHSTRRSDIRDLKGLPHEPLEYDR